MSTENDSASDHLRVIRQLMERATVYRAISAPTALLGGVAALALAWWLRDHGTGQLFLRAWLSLFAALAALNLFLLWLDARRRGQPFFSSGMRLALRAVVPPLLCGGVLGVAEVLIHGDLAACAILWCLFYGLALLATASFSPPSVQRLGSAFVAAGLIGFLGNQFGVSGFITANIMGATFGVLHLLYGLAVLTASRRATA
jgi:hypothetical protein